jgi:hypothetical protein
MTGQVIWHAGENVSDENEILLMGVPCEVCEHCGALAFQAEKDELFISAVHSPHCLVPKW